MIFFYDVVNEVHGYNCDFISISMFCFVLFCKFQHVLKFLFDFRYFRGTVGDSGLCLLVLCLLLFSPLIDLLCSKVQSDQYRIPS